MLTVLFFIAVFSSLTWLVYAGLYINGLLAGADLSSVTATTLAMYAGLTVLPIWVVWQIFGFVNQYFRTKSTDARLTQLFNQMKKNQDYTDLVVRVMLDAEHEIKDGFVINKFDIFVADMNEILADIIQRCNVASSLQMEQLWAKVKNGERWVIAKTLIEAAKNHADFAAYVAQKARKDNVFKGTLLEFCARYQNLNALLEKHDRDRVFITIIETGVMGKVYSILAPVADALTVPEQLEPEPEEEKTFEVSPNIINMQAPSNDDDKPSLWSRLNPFKTHKQQTQTSKDDNEFFEALQKSMNSPQEQHKSFQQQSEDNEPEVKVSADNVEHEPRLVEPETELKIVPAADKEEWNEENSPEFVAPLQNAVPEIIIDENARIGVTDSKNNSKTEPKEPNFAYPFGGWMNEDNYKK